MGIMVQAVEQESVMAIVGSSANSNGTRRGTIEY